jgi:hypothetical protein
MSTSTCHMLTSTASRSAPLHGGAHHSYSQLPSCADGARDCMLFLVQYIQIGRSLVERTRNIWRDRWVDAFVLFRELSELCIIFMTINVAYAPWLAWNTYAFHLRTASGVTPAPIGLLDARLRVSQHLVQV